MERLEKLTQDEFGVAHDEEGHMIPRDFLAKRGKIMTLVVEHPRLDIAEEVDRLAERDSVLIPQGANSYISSDFNPDTQHTRDGTDGSKRVFSVYAIQFYENLSRHKY